MAESIMDFTLAFYLDLRRETKTGYPIKLRVYHIETKQKILLSIGLTIQAKNKKVAQLEFEKAIEFNNSKQHILKRQLQSIMSEARQKADGLKPFSLQGFSKEFLNKLESGNNLQDYYQRKIEELLKYDQISSAESYRNSLRSIESFYNHENKKRDQLNFEHIDKVFLKDYSFYMETYEDSETGKKKASKATIGIYLRTLRAIFNLAKKDKCISEEQYPFLGRENGFKIPKSAKTHRALSQKELHFFYHECIPIKNTWKKAKDFWFWSFNSNGMNFSDILRLTNDDFNGKTPLTSDYFTFERRKTRNSLNSPTKVKVFINDFHREVLKEYSLPSNDKSGYVFGELSKKMNETLIKKKIDNFVRFTNQHLNALCLFYGIEKINTYAARHSYASHSRDKGAPIDYISESLAHSTVQQTMSYLSSLDDGRKKEFSRTLMDF